MSALLAFVAAVPCSAALGAPRMPRRTGRLTRPSMQLDSQASFWEARRAKLLADAARKAADLDSLRLRDTILHEALSKERQLAAASGGAPPAIAPHAEPAREAAAEPPHISELQERVASLEDELEAAQRLLEGLAEETRRTLAAAASKHEIELQRTAAFWIDRLSELESTADATLAEGLSAVEAAHDEAAAAAALRHERQVQQVGAFWIEKLQDTQRPAVGMLRLASEGDASAAAAAAAKAAALPVARDEVIDALEAELEKLEEKHEELAEQHQVGGRASSELVQS